MDLEGWNERYRTEGADEVPTRRLVETARQMVPGKALDLACGAGRNALWLAGEGWSVTAVDGAQRAIGILQERAQEKKLTVDARVADLEHGEYKIEPESWDLIAMCYYLQRDLLEPAKQGVRDGGVVIAIVHIVEPGEAPTKTRMSRGELHTYFEGWEIVHDYEGDSPDPAHRRKVAEVVARRG